MGRVDADSKNERDDEATAESESSESKREQVDAQVDADDGDEGDEPREVVRVGEEVDQGISPTQLGATRYVMAGFFVSSIAVAYVIGRMVPPPRHP